MSAPACHLEKITYRGFDALMLENGLVRCTVVPALGGKIVSLIHLPSMREWMWRNPHLEPSQPQFDANFVEKYDIGGYDECFPSIAATHFPVEPWSGTKVPDHGELWALPWKAETFCNGDTIEVRLVAHGVRFPYRFERKLLVDRGESGVRLAYTATNLSPFDFPFVWCAHPLLAVTPGMKVVLPLREMTVYSSPDGRFGNLGRTVRWPMVADLDGRAWDLSVPPEPGGQGLSVKLFGQSPSQGYIAVQDTVRGGELRMQFDPGEVTHLGMWINYGGWSGAPGAPPYYNIGIEPGIGVQDDLAVAYRQFGEFGILPGQGRKTWFLDLLLR